MPDGFNAWAVANRSRKTECMNPAPSSITFIYSMAIRFASYHCLSCKPLMKHCRNRIRNRIRIRYRYRIRVLYECLYFPQENKGIAWHLKFPLTPEFNICRIIRSTLKFPLTPKIEIFSRKSSTYTKKASLDNGKLFSLVVVCVLENGVILNASILYTIWIIL